ncbi:hypothetical protein NE237_019650 [Protea cynaroides]|uniref:Protein NBR1 homolog n=1 Tax=Protea cynaroides TaxID=273540 RepID=A0A9Q0H7X4_9MAGN|nr:hypothetical protein NE237_019650 [Protea cynaroides]
MSDLVIKVKYGDTLRRFSVDVQEDGSVDLNMVLLRAKILNLFKFAPDADLNLTYIDEDKDIVTLIDDDDLHDAFRQCLNPLRINILLNSTRIGRSDARFSGSSTPMRSASVHLSFPNINADVTESLKLIPEPFRSVLSKLSSDLAAKAASSTPALTELVECFSTLGLSNQSSVSQCYDGACSSTKGGASGNPVGFRVTEDLDSSKESAHVQNVIVANAKPADDRKECDSCNVTRGVGRTSVLRPATSVDFNLDPRNSTASAFSAAGFTVPTAPGHNDITFSGKDIQKEHDGNLGGMSVASGTSFYTFSDHPVHVNPHTSKASNIEKLPFSAINTQGGSSVLGGDSNKQLPTGLGYSAVSLVDINPQSKGPFSGQTGVESSDVVPPGGHYRYHLSKRSDRIFHKGVTCDGCSVHPITGPRFKSKVKENYDLCSSCYSKMGNEADYVRMDRPRSYHSPRILSKELCDPHRRFPSQSQSHKLQGYGVRPCGPKLDSCFIEDVNVIDGTMVAPESPFTKIWRMRNNGTIAWPRGTHLVWIGGNQFSDKFSMELEIPVYGFPVDKDLDVAVDFRAPQRPGRYVSYWRMASPSGQKFGQRVWVLIQVDASQEDSIAIGFHGLNLNLPPECSGAKGPEIVDVNVESADSSHLESGQPNMETELVKPVIDEHPSKDPALEFPVNDSLLVGSGVSVPVQPGIPALASYPMIDLSERPSELSPLINMETSAEETQSDIVEKTLLKELEEMGFKQMNLNKEILRMNEYNLEHSVDYLCDVAEWDPILEELQEMGFCDGETNKKLLIKNGGSIKRVVMDLIAGESRVETSPPAV